MVAFDAFVDADNAGLAVLFLSVAVAGGFFEGAAEGFAECLREVADHADVDGDVVFLGGRGEGEGVVLPDGDFGAAQEDVLTGARVRVLLLDLDLDDVRGVLDNLADEGLVLSAHLTPPAFAEVEDSAKHPELPEHADTIAKRFTVGFDHAEGAVEGPEEEEDQEQVVRVPEPLEVGLFRLFEGRAGHGREADEHDIAGPAWAGHKVGLEPAGEP